MNNFDIRSPVLLIYLFLSLLVGVPVFFLSGKSFFMPLVVALASSFLLILIMMGLKIILLLTFLGKCMVIMIFKLN